MKTHKMHEFKVRPGYNPFKPYCETDEEVSHMARDWKDVDCGQCWRKYKASKPRPVRHSRGKK